MTQRGLYDRSVYDLHAHEKVTDAVASAFTRRSIPRVGVVDLAMVATTAVALNVRMPLEAGDTFSNLNVCIGATALGTPTHQFAAWYDEKDVLITQTPDITSATGLANTTKTFTWASPQVVPRSGGIYSFSIVFVATTMPTLLGQMVASPIATGEITICRTHGSSLVATAPGTVATPTATNFVPYVELT